jgi:hypothetical protein
MAAIDAKMGAIHATNRPRAKVCCKSPRLTLQPAAPIQNNFEKNWEDRRFINGYPFSVFPCGK